MHAKQSCFSIMESNRIVEILQNKKSLGSGYLFTPRHVLTARHVPKPSEVGTECLIRPLRDAGRDPASHNLHGRPPSVPAKVKWVSDEHDLAVIETAAPISNIETTSVTFGNVSDVKPRESCSASGFPLASRDEQSSRDDQRTIFGTLTWVLTEPRFDFDVTSAPPRFWRTWAGFSGAAVFAGNLLVGVVRTVDPMWNGRVLEVTPVKYLKDDSSFLEFFKKTNFSLPHLVEVQPGAREIWEAIHQRAYGDLALPLDFDEAIPIPDNNSRRFSSLNARVQFFGRHHELAELDAFLDDKRDRSFAWWLITGGGGAGKTRLAREFCMRRHMSGWRTGFLPLGFDANKYPLHTCVPEMPTLIVADYALRYATNIRMLAARLARRVNLPPVRLLLLERKEDEAFDRQFLGSDQSDRIQIEWTRYREKPLAIPDLSDEDIWSLVEYCPWREDGMHLAVSRDEFLVRFHKLDSERRVLVAMILADALVTSPHRAGLDNLDDVLRSHLIRERDLMWPTELGVLGSTIGTTDADIAIAFATMVDGLRLNDLNAIDLARGKPLDRAILPACGRAIGKPLDEGRLEPDLIGEFFVLETLRDDREKKQYTKPPYWLSEAAWRAHGSTMEDFVTRATQNFPSHPSISRIAIIVPGVKESWHRMAFNELVKSVDKNQAFADVQDILLAAAKFDIGAALTFAECTLLITSLDVNHYSLKLQLTTTFLYALGALLGAHPAEADLRRAWAGSVRNFIYCLPFYDIDSNLDRCHLLLDEGAMLHAAHPTEPELREEWAMATWNFIHACASKDPDGCCSRLNALAKLHAAYPAEAVLREAWAGSAQNFVADRASNEPDRCRWLLNKLGRLHTLYPAEPVLRKEWAIAVMYFIDGCTAQDPDRCRLLLNKLGRLHTLHPAEPELRKEWAKSIISFVDDCATRDPDRCRLLLNKLAKLYNAHPAESVLRLAWANSIANFVSAHATEDSNRCRSLLNALAKLHIAHPAEPVLREAWARSIVNFVGCRAVQDPDRCRLLLNKLAKLHIAHPAEPILREAWAMSVRNFVSARATEDPNRCRSFLIALGKLYMAHPAESRLVEHLDMGVRHFVEDCGEQDSIGCSSLLHWVEWLREPWKSGATIIHETGKVTHIGINPA